MLGTYGARLVWRKVLYAAMVIVSLAHVARADTVVVTLGDSLTAGYGLSEPDGFAAQLQSWLDAAGARARIVNGSVSGDTTAGGRARAAWVLGEDVDAVIVQLGANDFLRGLDPGQARSNLSAIMQEVSAKGLAALIVALPAPSNYGAAYKEAFDAIYPDLAAAHGALLVPDMFAPLRALGLERMGEVMQPDGLHPNANGVALIVEALGPQVLALITRADASS